MNKINAILPGLLIVMLLAGCNDKVLKRDPAFAASRPAVLVPPERRTGAIYQAGYDVALFEDIKARRIGDILTIRLVENTNATKKSATNIDRSNSTSVTNPTLFGTTPEFNLPPFSPLASTTNLGLGASLESASQFGGESDSSQSNSLSGDITVSVVEVLPNGNLVVRGEKRMNLNQGNEYVRISGIVRRVDIAADNSVPSTRVADATISYTGEGAVADVNVIGWLARFFISAVFPF